MCRFHFVIDPEAGHKKILATQLKNSELELEKKKKEGNESGNP
jgi:hypothetical protein